MVLNVSKGSSDEVHRIPVRIVCDLLRCFSWKYLVNDSFFFDKGVHILYRYLIDLKQERISCSYCKLVWTIYARRVILRGLNVGWYSAVNLWHLQDKKMNTDFAILQSDPRIKWCNTLERERTRRDVTVTSITIGMWVSSNGTAVIMHRGIIPPRCTPKIFDWLGHLRSFNDQSGVHTNEMENF